MQAKDLFLVPDGGFIADALTSNRREARSCARPRPSQAVRRTAPVYLYIDDCVKSAQSIMAGDILEPISFGPKELVGVVEAIASTKLRRSCDLDVHTSIRGRNNDNSIILNRLGCEPPIHFVYRLERNYAWTYDQIVAARLPAAAA